MYLTKQEEEALNGEKGEAVKIAMEVIVKVGEALGAERLIEINHAHISGISYNNIGEPGLRFIENIRSKGARFRVPTTINPIGVDLEDPAGIPGATREFIMKQKQVIENLVAMDAKPVMTCTPYYVDKVKPGWHLAWGESSAVAYANTYIGAWTNREGGPLALMAAIAGRTYYAGVHIPENRVPRTAFTVHGYTNDQAIASVIGSIVARETKYKQPMINGVKGIREPEIKTMCAAAGAAGNLEMCVIPGITKVDISKSVLEEKIHIEKGDLEAELDQYRPTEMPDVVFIGCPHVGIEELEEVAKLAVSHGGQARNHFWIATSRKVYSRAVQLGLVEKLRDRNIRVLRDTCIVVSPGWRETGYTVATNSYKTMFYLKRIHGLKTYMAPLRELIEISLR